MPDRKKIPSKKEFEEQVLEVVDKKLTDLREKKLKEAKSEEKKD